MESTSVERGQGNGGGRQRGGGGNDGSGILCAHGALLEPARGGGVLEPGYKEAGVSVSGP